MKEILKVNNLSASLSGFPILEKISFDVKEGETLAILGPNGSGKTTLFRALIGMIPSEGTIHWRKDARIGYVPQKLDIDRQFPITVMDFLHAKAKISGADDQSVHTNIEYVKLPKTILNKSIGKISSGQLQRTMVAFSLIGNPNVLLFDEPTASVDIAGEEEIYETLHRLQDERNITMIIISHDLHLIFKHAANVLCINKKQICYGEPSRALTAQNLELLYGHHPALFHHIHTGKH